MTDSPSTKPLVAVFDIATSTGVCLGWVGGGYPDYVATWDLRTAGKSRPRRLLYISKLCADFFAKHQPDVVRYEAPMRLAAMGKMGTSEEVMLLLRGAIGVLECEAARAEIPDIGSFNVQDARHHFVGARTFKRGTNGRSGAKDAVMRQCEILVIKVKNDNEGDAVAGWSYTCGLLNPRIAHLVTPLFMQ